MLSNNYFIFLLCKNGNLYLIIAVFALFLYSCKTLPQYGTHRNIVNIDKSNFLDHVWIDSSWTNAPEDIIFINAIKARNIGNTEDAYKYFTAFSKMNPRHPVAYYEISKLLLLKNDQKRALEASQQAVRNNNDNIWIQSHHADLLAYDGQYIAAANFLGSIAKKTLKPQEFLLRKSFLLQKAKKYDEALSVLEELEKHVGSEDEVVILQKEQLYLNKNEVELAANEIRKLITLYPNDPEYIIRLAQIYESNELKEEAQQTYELAYQKFPSEIMIQLSLAQHYLNQGDTTKFNAFFKKVISNESLTTEDQLALLYPYLEMRLADSSAATKVEIKSFLQPILIQEKSNLPVMLLYAEILEHEGNIDSSLVYLKKIIEIDAKQYTIWQKIVFIYLDKGKYEESIEHTLKAIEHFPESPFLYYFLGISYQMENEYIKAIEALLKAIENDKDINSEFRSGVYVMMGDNYASIKEYTSSDSCYEKALILNPNNEMALNNYSYFLSERNERLEDALKMSATSLEIRPDEASFLDTYGWILYRLGKYQEAEKYIQKAIDASKEEISSTLYDHMGDVLLKLGEIDKAVQFWNMALKKISTKENDYIRNKEKLEYKIKYRKLKD